MLFNSFNFWVLFPFIFAFYWVIPSCHVKAKKTFLIATSYLLYMNWDAAYSLILLSITAITYIAGLSFESNKRNYKKAIPFYVAMTIIPLCIFKYYNFITDNANSILDYCGLHFHLPGLNWFIPIGISFYTFQALGYMLDVYYGKIKAERSFTDYLLFCSFFPQTASGPISKASELLPQIKNPKSFNYRQGTEGLKILLWGMFLKVVVADRLGLYTDTVYSNYEHFSGANCLLASVFYSIQIYGDFAGYSFMAIGIGKILGYDLVNNFERPYLADSITNFWKRWHISLTRWLTAYIYIPLGGNRCSKFKQYTNIMTTFLVSGIWHGANWTFIVWGGIHGILQITEKAFGLDPKGKIAKHDLFRKIKPLRILITFFIVNLAWIFFRMPTIEDASNIIARIFTNYDGQAIMHTANNTDKLLSVMAIGILCMFEVKQEYFSRRFRIAENPAIRWIAYATIFCMILATGVLDASSFIYVSF